MNTLREDTEEVVTPKEKAWVGRKRREHFIEPDEPATWFAELECGEHAPALVSLGRSAGDVLETAAMYAQSKLGYALGTGRWMIDNNAGSEGEHSTYLVVYPRHDPEGAE